MALHDPGPSSSRRLIQEFVQVAPVESALGLQTIQCTPFSVQNNVWTMAQVETVNLRLLAWVSQMLAGATRPGIEVRTFELPVRLMF